jgi:hypothetical protein
LLVRFEPARCLEDVVERRFPLDPSGTFSLRAIDGTVEIFGTDSQEVKIVAVKKAFSPERLNAIAIRVDARQDVVNIETTPPPAPRHHFLDRSGTVEYTINIPQTARIARVELPNGDLVIDGMRGASIAANLGSGQARDTQLFLRQTIHVNQGALNVFFDWMEEERPISIEARLRMETCRRASQRTQPFICTPLRRTGHVSSDFSPMGTRQRGDDSEIKRSDRRRPGNQADLSRWRGKYPLFGGDLVIWRDLRYAIRSLIKSPGFFAIAFIAIALGIGVNTTILGIVNTLLMRPLPIGHSDRVVQLFTSDSHFTGRNPNSYLNFLDYQKQNSVFTGMAGLHLCRDRHDARRRNHLMFSANWSAGIISICSSSTRFWDADSSQKRTPRRTGIRSRLSVTSFGRNLAVIATSLVAALTLNGHAFTVIGVAPAGFTGIDIGVAPEIWTPLAMHGWIRPSGDEWFEMRRGSFSQRRCALETRHFLLRRASPDANRGAPTRTGLSRREQRTLRSLLPAEKAKSQGIGGRGTRIRAQNISLLLLVAAGSILLIACANVANLLLARATARQRKWQFASRSAPDAAGSSASC